MLKTLLRRLGVGAPVAIPEASWRAALEELPFLARLSPAELERLRALAGQFLGQKEMAGAADLELTAAIQVHIAIQACLPILNLGLDWYRGWTSIVVYPNEFLVPRRHADETGVVHEYVEPISGEAWEGGPVLISWDDAARAGAQGADPYSVVIHEFTHKLDMLDGEANGCPPFDARIHAGLDRDHWRRTLEDGFERLNAELDLIEARIPGDVDPDSEEADPYYAHLPLDPYAAQHPGEFFAVSSEVFFVDAARLQLAFPEWYRLLALFFRQDPLAAAGP
jgi:Mlc titration factor MtfA (ptsG expression regulator)